MKSPVRNVTSKPLLQHQSSRKSSGVSLLNCHCAFRVYFITYLPFHPCRAIAAGRRAEHLAARPARRIRRRWESIQTTRFPVPCPAWAWPTWVAAAHTKDRSKAKAPKPPPGGADSSVPPTRCVSVWQSLGVIGIVNGVSSFRIPKWTY